MEDYVFFWMTGEENEFLSNWFPCTFEIDGQIYENTEQFFMAKKAQIFHDDRIYKKILETSDPKKCKELGNSVSDFVLEIWDRCRFDIMTEGNLAKFGQNEDLKKKLFETGDKLLVEASPIDKIWGIGKSREEAQNMKPEQWPGQNLQGKCLMKVRKLLREEK